VHRGKICSFTFVISIFNVLEPCAALPSLKQFATVFHLPASLSAFPLTHSTPIKTVEFFDGPASSPGCHLSEPIEPKEETWLPGSTIFDPTGAREYTWSEHVRSTSE
jgi:hypothetical protein